MGRHSAPDEVDDDAADTEVSAPAVDPGVGPGSGRHSRSDQELADAADQSHTQRIAVVDDLLLPEADAGTKADTKAAEKAAERAEKDARKAQRKAQRSESGTRADLRVLREHAAVRAQVIGAVVASFLVYTLVLIALGRSSDYLVWLWIPIVACGVLVGLVLDLAHRRLRRRGEPADGPTAGPTG